MAKWMAAWSVSITIGSVLFAIISFWGVIWIVLWLPADYFLHHRRQQLRRCHPAVYVSWLIGKNLLGLGLVALGVAMLILPGQGLLSVLLGISLCDFPYKQSLIQSILRRSAVQKSLNWIRRKGNREPLRFPDGVGAADSTSQD